jgi:erythromycin esterase-like protein
MPLPRLTWAGLLVATLGWALLLTYPLVAALAGGPDGNAVRDPARFLLIFGENAILTGFAIALLGVMEKVIDLLGRQAATVHPAKTVAATAARTQLAQQQFAAQQFQASQFQAAPFQSQQQAANQLAASQLHAVQQLSPTQLMTSRQTNEVVTRGALSGRDYVLFRDGSVVVETLLGPRRFLSLSEAQEFIGVN